jgi:hypothetical protein
MPAEERLAYIERFAKEVLPELHRLEAASVP